MERVGGVSWKGVQAPEVRNETVHLLHADARRGMANLPMEIGGLNDIAVDDADGPHSGTGDVLSGGTAETTRSDNKHSGVDQAELP